LQKKKRCVSWADLQSDSSESDRDLRLYICNSYENGTNMEDYPKEEVKNLPCIKPNINLFGPQYKSSKSTQTIIRPIPQRRSSYYHKFSKDPIIRGIWWKNAW